MDARTAMGESANTWLKMVLFIGELSNAGT